MTDYEKICDFCNLYLAHLEARKGKRGKMEVIRFENHLSENLTKMSWSLQNRSYQVHEYYHFTVHEPKKREIFAAHYSDRVMLHCVCDQVLSPLLERHLIYDNAACRTGKGSHFALDRFSQFLREHYRAHGAHGYALKCDVTQYFASIDHEVLKAALKRLLKDPDVRTLLYHVIDSYESEGRPGRGLPLGNQSSQCFAIYYLDPLDRLIKERLRVKHYVRYMDDWILLHPDRAFLEHCLKEIRRMVEETLSLKLNPKTQIFAIGEGVEFLGWRFYLSDTGKVIRKLRPSSKLRIQRNMKTLWKGYESGELERETVRSSLAAYRGHLRHGDTYAMQGRLRLMLAQVEQTAHHNGEERDQNELVSSESEHPLRPDPPPCPDPGRHLRLAEREPAGAERGQLEAGYGNGGAG